MFFRFSLASVFCSARPLARVAGKSKNAAKSKKAKTKTKQIQSRGVHLCCGGLKELCNILIAPIFNGTLPDLDLSLTSVQGSRLIFTGTPGGQDTQYRASPDLFRRIRLFSLFFILKCSGKCLTLFSFYITKLDSSILSHSSYDRSPQPLVYILRVL